MPAVLSALGKDFYVLHFTTSFNAIHLATAVKVDVYVAGPDPFNAERLAHRERAQIWPEPPGELFIDTAEHIVLRKLEYCRRGDEVSDRQWRDAVGVLRVKQGKLDEVRMDLWAERLGVTDLLQRVREDAR